MALLSANELTLSYGAQHLLEGVTIAVEPGEKVGLVGRNGCGKTSLLKILANAQQPDSGEVSRRRGLRTGYLPQEFELDGTLTVRQNIEAGAADLVEWIRRYENGEGTDAEHEEFLHLIEAADGWNLVSRIKSIATALNGPPLDAFVGPLSGGEKRRVALCQALVGQPDLLLLDEPTNHLDADSIRWLETFLRNFPGAVIFVTHDRYFLDVIATRIAEIANGRSFSHPGNYTAFLEAKALRQQISEQGERRRQRFLQAELEYVRAGVRAQRSKSRNRLENFYKVAGLEAPPEEREMDLILPPPPEIGNIGVELAGAGAKVTRDGVERWLFRDLNLSIKPGECTGIVGPNGAGKTTLIRLCLGERAPDEGTVTIGKKVVFNFIDQNRLELDNTKTVIEEVADSGGETVSFGDKKLSVRGYLRRFNFSDERVRERVDRLSGGERARLLLAKVLKRGGNMIILDEPTNDLDLQSLRILEEALVSFQGGVLVVSHDRYFLDRICDQVVAFEENGVFVQPGNYSYYLEKRKTRTSQNTAPVAAAKAAPANITSQAPAAPKPAKARKLNFKEQRELETMEATIHTKEQEVEKLEAQLNDPSFYITRATEAPAMIADLEAKKAEVIRLYSRWEELESVGR